LITDVLQVPSPPMRDLSFGRSLAASEPKTLPEPLTAEIRAVCRPHLPKGGVIGDSDGPCAGIVACQRLTVGLTLRFVRFGGSR
jgi:hypothetical protein